MSDPSGPESVYSFGSVSFYVTKEVLRCACPPARSQVRTQRVGDTVVDEILLGPQTRSPAPEGRKRRPRTLDTVGTTLCR